MKKTEKMNVWIERKRKDFQCFIMIWIFFWNQMKTKQFVVCLSVCSLMKWNEIIFFLFFKSDRFFVSLSGKRKIFIIHLDNLTNNRTKIKFESRWRRKRKIIETGNIKTILEHESQNKQTDKKSRKSRNVHRSINRNDHLMFQKQ